MSDKERIDKLSEQGYLIFPVINLSNYTSDSLAKAHKVFNMASSLEVLNDEKNKKKSLIILRHLSSNDQIEIITSDQLTIQRALELHRYQNEPVGAIFRANVKALGGSSTTQRVFHLDQLISNLDDLWDWKFSLGNKVGEFEVEVKLNSWSTTDIRNVLDRLQVLVYCLALTLSVGFSIQHYPIAYITRYNHPLLFSGSEERMLEGVSKEDISKYVEEMITNSDYRDAARGLNEAYIENTLPGRLSKLWAGVENTFNSKPKRLLTDEEVELLFKFIEQIPSLVNDTDRQKKLREAISNPIILPLIARNERIADGIASILHIDRAESYKRVRKAAELRGKHSHRISDVETSEMEASEQFLQEALRKYLQQLTN